MPFHRIEMLPNFDALEARQTRSRWNDADGIKDKIVELIRAGAGEDFLQGEFEAGRLGFVRDQWDLAGIDLFKEEIEFPKNDSFENIDFSYAKFWHCIFSNATFPQTHFTFARLYNVEFRNCLFGFAHFYGATLEKCKFINCDFVEENGFSNCEFIDVRFDDCFFNKNKFVDCRFDENVHFTSSKGERRLGLLVAPSSGFKERMEETNISGIYRNIKDCYFAGQVYVQVRKYLFLQHQAYTRYNRLGRFNKLKRYVWEIVAGYGAKPIRVLLCLGVLYLLVSFRFSYALGDVKDGILLSSGAFLTFGAKSDLLASMGLFDNCLYIASAFVGISMVALLITVMANVLLKDS
ncbi:MAG: pentapeptide repeat-containing protein [Tumebacillaceae bacterium]